MNTLREKLKSLKGQNTLKKLGVAGFLFFLVKGLIWLALAGWAWLTLNK